MTEQERAYYFCNIEYEFIRYDKFDYTILNLCPCDQMRGRNKDKINECFIMFDTETSKSFPDRYKLEKVKKRPDKRVYEVNENYIVAWTLAINIYGFNVVCLWGSTPSSLVETIRKINDSLPGTKTIYYCHNLGFDWIFIRQFMFREFGIPIEQLFSKPHYPIDLEFVEGIHLRDSLILSQRSIERWAKDFCVEHQKAVGSWDYDKIRHQNGIFSDEELLYIQNDVLAGVECLNELRKNLHKTFAGMPYTQTGIVRAEAKKRGKKNQAHKKAMSYYTTLQLYDLLEELYHGGYTHANRHYLGYINEGKIECYDFASSYPFCLLCKKMPIENFSLLGYDPAPEEILNSEEEAFIFTFKACGVRLKNPNDPFPVLQLSKARKVYNGLFDNGRILETDFLEIVCNEVDFQRIYKQYEWDRCWITDVYFAYKDYLPAWLSDLIFELFKQKTDLKGGDAVAYAISKGMLNSIY